MKEVKQYTRWQKNLLKKQFSVFLENIDLQECKQNLFVKKEQPYLASQCSLLANDTHKNTKATEIGRIYRKSQFKILPD